MDECFPLEEVGLREEKGGKEGKEGRDVELGLWSGKGEGGRLTSFTGPVKSKTEIRLCSRL